VLSQAIRGDFAASINEPYDPGTLSNTHTMKIIFCLKVWGYGSITDDSSFASPSLPIEATVNKCVRIKWLNQLVDAGNNFLPHLIPAVEQNIHWANPGRFISLREERREIERKEKKKKREKKKKIKKNKKKKN